jgi:hypothetical protein
MLGASAVAYLPLAICTLSATSCPCVTEAMPEAWHTRLSTQGNTPRRPAGLAALIFCPSCRKGELSLFANDTVQCRLYLSIVTRSPQTCLTTLLTCV